MAIAKSAFQTPLTIKEAIESIHRKKFLLPAIQRELVWEPEQIIKLFDSLMRDYPIGSFLFWNINKDRIKDFQFYEFIRNYHERDSRHNPKANVTGEESITAVLDGQQRLTALYIGLKGTYAYKIPWKRWNSHDAFPIRKLYLNLLSKSDEFDLLYDFRFLTPLESSMRDEKTYWFEVGKILEFTSLRDINKYLRDNGLIESEFAEECLFKLYDTINEKRVINYYLETSQELTKVLNIFIRVNSGGTILSYSDLLLSIATAQWKTKDAREEIIGFVEEVNKIGDGFKFDKDFVLKSCLVLSDIVDIAFKVDNFNIDNMNKIEENWEIIKKSIKLSVELISSFGYNLETLTSTTAVIPIAYYIKKLGNPDSFVQSSTYRQDRERICKWLRYSLIKRSFSGQPDNVLRPIRKIIKENQNGFPLNEIIDNFKGTTKSLTFTEDELESLLYYKYGEPHTFSVLSLLYPTLDFRNRFHQDHIFPKSFFKKSELRKKGIPEDKIEFYLESYNYLGNLQLLEGLPNEEKSNMDFKIWLEKTYPCEDERREYMKKHLIPQDIDLTLGNFEQFLKERNKLILKKLKETLS
jgi:uncharacterized protein with ParB-like and HNH nuclease domain